MVINGGGPVYDFDIDTAPRQRCEDRRPITDRRVVRHLYASIATAFTAGVLAGVLACWWLS